jgi:hypothetical protein
MMRSAWWSRAGFVVILLVGLLGIGGAASRPGGWLLGVPSVGAGLVWALAVAVVAWLVSPARAGVGACGVGLLPVVALAISGLPLPGLAALTGPPLVAVALAGIVAVLATSGWRPPDWTFFPLVLVLYAGVSIRVQTQVGPQGDEPHYLMVADSILRDGDVSLERDYEQGRYQAFFDGMLSPHYRVRGKGGEIYSLHALGLSLLILPFYAAGSYPAASLFMALLAALLAREIRELLRATLHDDAVATGVAWVIALGPPLIHYAGLVFTEVPAALALAVALRQAPTARAWGAARALVVGSLLGFLPWLNVRYVLLAIVVGLYVLWQGLRARSAVCLVAPGFASAAGLALYHHALYGFFDPRLVYGRRPEFSLAILPEGLPGLLLDQEFGLLVYAPVFALCLSGLVFLWRRDHKAAVVVVTGIALTAFTAAAWPMWRGGFNPPARFLVPVLPLLALAVASALRARITAGAALLIAFTIWAGCLGAVEPRLVHRDRDGTAPFWRAASGAEEWTRLLPGYVLADVDRNRLALAWAVALAAAVLARKPPAPTTMALATAGLLAAVCVSSILSRARTEGRDAVRLIGRPAVAVPGWRGEACAAAEWGPESLDWGPLYEPHRHPAGAALGERLALRPGSYSVAVLGDDLAPGAPPALEVWPEASGPSARHRSSPFIAMRDRVQAGFTVGAGETAVTLRLRGGGARLLRRVILEAQPCGPGPV